jgi:ubiquinone/menaquinone biosynthesis C-methylase UbiE
LSDRNEANFTGSVPEFYDRNLGPVIFEGYAAEMARKAAAHAPQRVLELAAGTGIVTRQLRRALPPESRLVATDLNPPMLDIARAKFTDRDDVAFRPADATALPFDDASFDLVVCQFGVMFFPDRPKSYREVRRVLAGAGRYLFSVWDALQHNPFGRVAFDAVARFFPGDPPQFYQVPFGHHRIDEIRAELSAAGFTDIRAHVLRREEPNVDPDAFARGLVLGNPLAEQIRARGTVRVETVIDGVAAALRDSLGLPGRALPMQVIFLEAK